MGQRITRIATILSNLGQCCRLEIHPRPENIAQASVATPDLPWEQPPKVLTLARGEIHLWRAQLDQQVADLDQFNPILSEDEKMRAARYRFEKDRRSFTLRRSLLRLILGRYLEIEPARLQFSYGHWGKPALAHPRDGNLHFNLSHSDGVALYAVTHDGAVGVDIERVRVIQEARQIADRFFSPQEVAAWLSLPGDEQPESFLRHWSRKEACLKATGRGLFDITEPASSRPKKVERNEPANGPHCSGPPTADVFYELTPADEYVGALAIAVPGQVRD